MSISQSQAPNPVAGTYTVADWEHAAAFLGSVSVGFPEFQTVGIEPPMLQGLTLSTQNITPEDNSVTTGP